MGNDRVTPGSQTSLREANRARIVSAVQQRGSLTQVELAGVTGLSPATVSNIVKELTSAGVLHTAPTSRSGRRAQQVTLARNLGLVAGMHFGTRSLRVALSDVAHRIVAEQRMPLPPDHRADQGLERAALLLTEMVDSVDAALSEVLAVGVGVPAPVDVRTGQMSSPRHAPRVGRRRGAAAARATGWACPCTSTTTPTSARSPRSGSVPRAGKQHVVYVRASHGVGGGLVLGGEVFHGRVGAAGEIGHTTIDDHGPVCRCGNRGCLEMYVGAPVLLDMLRPSHGNLTLRDVIARAEAGDAGCRRVIADAGPPPRRRRGRRVQPVRPRARRHRRRARGRGRDAAGAAARGAHGAAHHPQHRRTRARSSRAELGAAAEVRGALAVALDTVTIGGAGTVVVVTRARTRASRRRSSSPRFARSGLGCADRPRGRRPLREAIALLLPESKTARYEAVDRPSFEGVVADRCAECTRASTPTPTRTRRCSSSRPSPC